MKSLHMVVMLSTMIALSEMMSFLVETKKSGKYKDRDVVGSVELEPGEDYSADYSGPEDEYYADYSNNGKHVLRS